MLTYLLAATAVRSHPVSSRIGDTVDIQIKTVKLNYDYSVVVKSELRDDLVL